MVGFPLVGAGYQHRCRCHGPVQTLWQEKTLELGRDGPDAHRAAVDPLLQARQLPHWKKGIAAAGAHRGFHFAGRPEPAP